MAVRKSVKRALVLLIAGSMMLGGVAHAMDTDSLTSLTLKASSTRIHKGQPVTFSGRLTSPRAKCEANKTITLFRGSKAVGSTTTDSTGHYSLVKHPKRTADWHTAFAGTTNGVHPNQHICEPSTSNTVTVRVH